MSIRVSIEYNSMENLEESFFDSIIGKRSKGDISYGIAEHPAHWVQM